MAYKLVCQYTDANGKTITHNWSPAGSGVTGQVVKSLMSACVTNGAIFKNVPVAIKEAKLVQTTETEITLPD